MKFFYFLVDWDGKYSTLLHEYFFEKGGAFGYGLLVAVAAALILALIYYLVLGRNVTTAKMGNWWICGAVALAVTFSISNWMIIGQEPSQREYSQARNLENKLTYKYSFYRSMDRAIKPGKGTLIKDGMLDSEKQQLVAEKKKVATNLNQGKDVRYMFSFNTTLWCAVFYFIASVLFKGFSQAAKTKPIKWPYK